MTQPAKAQEPSMEEILASIRRIIADDDSAKPGAQPAATAPEPPVQAVPVPAPSPMAALRVAAAPVRSEPSTFEPPQPPEPEPEAEPEPPAVNGSGGEQADILDLTESMAAAAPSSEAASAGEVPSFRTIDGSSDVGFAETPEQPATRVLRDPPPQLLSRETSAAVDSAFNTLAQTVLVQNARTLEDLVREMLRPMLKSWLDENLPGMVERLVRAEIERVSRGR